MVTKTSAVVEHVVEWGGFEERTLSGDDDARIARPGSGELGRRGRRVAVELGLDGHAGLPCADKVPNMTAHFSAPSTDLYGTPPTSGSSSGSVCTCRRVPGQYEHGCGASRDTPGLCFSHGGCQA